MLSMSDMVALDSLVANTVYLKALQVDKKQVSRHRLSISLPSPQKASALRDSVGAEYESLCELQPIGRRLFRDFLEASEDPRYVAAAELLRELKDWALVDTADRDAVRRRILARFCQRDCEGLLPCLNGHTAEEGKTPSDTEAMMDTLRGATREFLMDKPFSEYLRSPFFDRFLQWKQYEKQKITEKYFYEFRILGKGGFGEVCAVQVKHTGQMYACKKLDKKRLKRKGGEKMALLEKRILEKVNSPFIINLAYAYETKTHLCLVMNLMNGGDLKFHIYELGERGIPAERVVYYSAQITAGILHLHSMDIVYRDMKPENVLLDSHGQCRLSDLGLAVEVPVGETICTKAGTDGYMAPELLRQAEYRTSVDWWALGCSIYEMAAGRLPFRDYREKVHMDELVRRTLEDECKFEDGKFDTATRDVIAHLLKKRVDLRLGCRGDDPRRHKFFKNINFPRLEAGMLAPPWVPRPDIVYAKDADELCESSAVSGIELNAKDEKFFKEFNTGAVPIPWQQEMVDSGLFDELSDSNREARYYGDCDDATRTSRSCILL